MKKEIIAGALLTLFAAGCRGPSLDRCAASKTICAYYPIPNDPDDLINYAKTISHHRPVIVYVPGSENNPDHTLDMLAEATKGLRLITISGQLKTDVLILNANIQDKATRAFVTTYVGKSSHIYPQAHVVFNGRAITSLIGDGVTEKSIRETIGALPFTPTSDLKVQP